MGCDIHSFAERKLESGRWSAIKGLEPFGSRNYGTFGWLAGVRNYSDLTPISEPRGLPTPVSATVKREYNRWECDAHTPSWLSVAELQAVDYDQVIEDRRCTRRMANGVLNGGSTCAPGEGEKQTLREFLGPWFFKDLDALVAAGAERVVFWFDN